MGWICPSCGSENSFETEACRACGHREQPFRLAGERLATVRDRLYANQFDFLGRPLEERAWNRAGQAVGVWCGILPYALAVAVVFAVVALLLSGMPGLFSRVPHWQGAMAEAPQVLMDRGELAWESLLDDWRPEEERVQSAKDRLRAFTENSARTEELGRRAREDRSTARETAAELLPRLRTKFRFGRVTDRIKESGALALGGQQGLERRAGTREQAEELIAQYQKTITQRLQEIIEKVKSRLRSLGIG